MIVTLENEQLKVTVDTMGAEMQSLYEKNKQLEYLWQGDGRYWGGRAPVLFPFIGQSKDKTFSYEGASYAMKNHGFARNSEFTVTEQTATGVTLELSDNVDTKAVYPFSFKLAVTYELNDGTVQVKYDVINPDQEKPLYYSVGAHPGFNVPLADGETFEDYCITFEPVKTVKCLHLQDTVDFLLDDSLTKETELSKLLLHHEMFDNGLLAFDYEGDITCRLYSAKSGRGVAIHTKDMEQLCLWSPVKVSPFVCIEPWKGLPDFTTASGKLTEKAKINCLQPKQAASCGYTIELL